MSSSYMSQISIRRAAVRTGQFRGQFSTVPYHLYSSAAVQSKKDNPSTPSKPVARKGGSSSKNAISLEKLPQENGAIPPLSALELLKQVEKELGGDSTNQAHEPIPPPHPRVSYLEGLEKKLKAQREEAGTIARSQKVHHTIRERITAYLNKSSLDQRREIMDEAFAKGHFEDLAWVLKHGPKVGIAAKTAVPVTSAVQVPHFPMTSLSGKRTDLLSLCQSRNLTLVCYVFNAFGVPHVATYADRFRTEFIERYGRSAVNTLSSRSIPGIVNLNIEESMIKAPVLWLSIPRIRRSLTTQAERDGYFVYFGSLHRERIRMGISNKVIGWVQLVDRSGCIRWQANGPASPEELSAMLKISRHLMTADQSAMKSSVP